MASDRIEPCDVWKLARQRGSVVGDVALENLPRLAERLADTVGTLRYELRGGIDDRGRSAARLELDGSVRMRCDRCGALVDVPIREQAEFYFVTDEAELARLPIEDVPEEPLLASHLFDLASLIEDQALLALPISPRHGDCEAPTGTSAARESDGETQRPFEVLAALHRRKG